MECLCLACKNCIEEQKLIDSVYKGLELEELSDDQYYRWPLRLFGSPKFDTHRYTQLKEENGNRWYLVPKWISDPPAWVAAIREVNEIITNMNRDYFGGTKLLQK